MPNLLPSPTTRLSRPLPSRVHFVLREFQFVEPHPVQGPKPARSPHSTNPTASLQNRGDSLAIVPKVPSFNFQAFAALVPTLVRQSKFNARENIPAPRKPSRSSSVRIPRKRTAAEKEALVAPEAAQQANGIFKSLSLKPENHPKLYNTCRAKAAGFLLGTNEFFVFRNHLPLLPLARRFFNRFGLQHDEALRAQFLILLLEEDFTPAKLENYGDSLLKTFEQQLKHTGWKEIPKEARQTLARLLLTHSLLGKQKLVPAIQQLEKVLDTIACYGSQPTREIILRTLNHPKIESLEDFLFRIKMEADSLRNLRLTQLVLTLAKETSFAENCTLAGKLGLEIATAERIQISDVLFYVLALCVRYRYASISGLVHAYETSPGAFNAFLNHYGICGLRLDKEGRYIDVPLKAQDILELLESKNFDLVDEIIHRFYLTPLKSRYAPKRKKHD